MKQQLEQFPELVVSVPFFAHLYREGIETMRAKAILADGSNLRISEVWIDGHLRRYAYYWLDEQDALICGWDNAPHHPEISTHPHHKHLGEQLESSEVHSLANVLQLLKNRITP